MRISLPIFKAREIMILSRVFVYIYGCLFNVQENLDYYQIRGERIYINNKRNPTEKFSEGGASKTNKIHLHKN